MKNKILAELKKKFPGLQTEFLGFLAAKLEAKVTEETQIEGAIDELDKVLPIKDQADFFQSESDRRVTEAKKKFEAEKKPEDKKDDKKDPPPATDFAAMLKEVSDKLTALEKKDSQSKLSEVFHKKLTEKKIPAQFAKGRTIESEDQLDTVLAEAEADYEAVKQEMVNQGLASSTPPKGGGAGSTSKQASKEAVEDVISNII